MNKTFDMSNQNFLPKPRLNSIKEEDILFFSLFMDDKESIILSIRVAELMQQMSRARCTGLV